MSNMNVFILFLFISTTHCFIFPPKIHCSHTHTHIKLYDNNNDDELINLLNKNTNLTNIIYKHNFISSLNENVNNCIIYLLKRYDDNKDSFNDNMINNINSINVSSINENIKKMIHTKQVFTEKVRTPLRSLNDFFYKKINDVVKSNNNNNNFINLHYMLFKNQILESLTPTEKTKGSDESHCDNCHCYECHIKGCYENDLHTKECEECHKEECSGCCNCEECLVENEECYKEECSGCCNCEECLVENEECHKTECSGNCNCGECIVENTKSNSTYEVPIITTPLASFIDTVGIVPVGILPNFIIRFLLKNLLMPF